MDILILLIPLSLVLVGVIAWIMLWAAKSGQFDDLEGPGHSGRQSAQIRRRAQALTDAELRCD